MLFNFTEYPTVNHSIKKESLKLKLDVFSMILSNNVMTSFYVSVRYVLDE